MNKILLVGCGYWGKNWYKTILSSQHELVGVVDPNPVVDVTVPLFNSIEEVNVEYTHAIIATNAELHLNLKNQLRLGLKYKNLEKEKLLKVDLFFENLEKGKISLDLEKYKFI